MTRLFFAFLPDRPKREAVAAWRDTCDFGPSARLVPTENLHVTLHFLGDVAPAAIAELRSAAAAAPFAKGHLELRAPEVWRHGVAVLQAEASSELVELRGRLAEAVASFVQTPDVRIWMPHLTLAYQASETASQIEEASPPLGGWEVRRFGLFESLGGRYREIATFSAG